MKYVFQDLRALCQSFMRGYRPARAKERAEMPVLWAEAKRSGSAVVCMGWAILVALITRQPARITRELFRQESIKKGGKEAGK